MVAINIYHLCKALFAETQTDEPKK